MLRPDTSVDERAPTAARAEAHSNVGRPKYLHRGRFGRTVQAWIL